MQPSVRPHRRTARLAALVALAALVPTAAVPRAARADAPRASASARLSIVKLPAPVAPFPGLPAGPPVVAFGGTEALIGLDAAAFASAGPVAIVLDVDGAGAGASLAPAGDRCDAAPDGPPADACAGDPSHLIRVRLASDASTPVDDPLPAIRVRVVAE